MPEDTWETAIGGETTSTETSATAEEATAGSEPSAAPPSEAESPTLETDAPQLETEGAAREGESPTEQVTEPERADEDIQEGDTPEILALPSGSAARKWARRQFHDAEPTRKYLDFNKPISEFNDDLFARSKSRYGEAFEDMLDNHPDQAAQKLFGLSYEEAQARLGSADTRVETPTPATQADTAELFTEEELNGLPWDAADRLKEFQEAQGRKEAELKAANDALQKRLDALEGKFTSKEQQEQQRLVEARQAEAAKIGNDLYMSVWKVVEEGVKSTGLEVSPNDPPRIANLKRAAQDLLSKERIEDAFDNDPENGDENRKLVESVMLAASRGERSVAFREEDNLKVRARQAFERVKQSPQVQAILDELKSFDNSQAQTKRGIPAPPVPGASAGIMPKAPTTWDEAVAG